MIKVLNRLNLQPKIRAMMEHQGKTSGAFKLRIGISMGPVIAGGKKRTQKA